jgi:hypothetical protein
MGYPAFHKIDSPLDIPSKLEVVSIKLPDTCLGKAIFVKFEGVSLNYQECRLDYILISIKCEIFV